MQELQEQFQVPHAQRGMGSVYLPTKRTKVYWVKYYKDGRPVRESSGSKVKKRAEKLLQRRLGEMAAGTFVGPKAERVKVQELADAMLRDYRINARSSLAETERRWKKRLLPYFGHMRAVSVTTDELNRYVEKHRDAGLDNATINRDMAALKRAFYLAYRSTPRKVHSVPTFPRLRENPPRKGFVEEAQYTLLAANADELWLRTMLALGYTFGFREGELLSLQVRQIDLLNETIRLDVGETKNGEGREVMFNDMPEIRALLVACVSGKGPDAHVFTHADGSDVLDFRGAWQALVIRTGLGKRLCMSCGENIVQTRRCEKCSSRKTPKFIGLLFHDLRRSAVRNMVRRGVPERVAMTISGHKTRSVFDRYNIVSEADRREAARRIHAGTQPVTSANVNGQTMGKLDVETDTQRQGTSSQMTYNQ